MKALLFYRLAPDGLAQVPAHMPAHRARLEAFHAQGTLLMAGPYGMPPIGALGIFTSRDAANAFVSEDPFVVHGLVAEVTLHDWAEGLSNTAS